MKILNDEIPKLKPKGVDANHIVKDINWPMPTWIDDRLYKAEFIRNDQLIVDMFNSLGAAIEKAMANETADYQTITFDDLLDQAKAVVQRLMALIAPKGL